MSVYLITGAAMGLGQALTKNLLAAGHEVILLDKELKALNKLYDELDSENVALYPMDLLGANIDDYKALQTNLENEFGKLGGVFLNAAILPAFTPIEHFDYTQWYEVLHTNLNANFHLIQQTLPLLAKSTDAKLVAVTDNSVNNHPAYFGAYGVAKAGLEQLMRTVAQETKQTTTASYIVRLESFATESRGRLFPGENPTELISADDMASFILDNISNKPIMTTTVDFGEIVKL